MRMATLSMLVLLAGCFGSHLPEDFAAPEGLRTDLFEIERLSSEDAKHVYEAVVESREMIRESMPEEAWPRQGMTYENQRLHIAARERAFEAGKCFCYAIKEPGEARVIGGVLVEPSRGGRAASVYYWVRKTEFLKGYEPVVDRALRGWFKTGWSFEKVDFPGRNSQVWARQEGEGARSR